MDKDDIMNTLGNDGIRLSTGKATHVELVEDDEEKPTYKIKFELMDVGVYNIVHFTEENLKFMVSEFNRDKNGVVFHGLDHSWDTLDQIGKIYELQLEGKGKRTKVFALSELYKETPAQIHSHTLFKQGLLKFVSGTWFPTKYSWNEKENHIDIEEPKLREMSSTPMPAKEDAKQKEILNSLNHAPNMEESNMTEDNQDNNEPSREGEDVVEQSAELTALKKEMQAEIEATKKVRESLEQATADLQSGIADTKRASLLEGAKELGLSEESIAEDKSNDEIEFALKVAKEVRMKLLEERDPTIQLGGEDGTALQDGSPEMIVKLEKEYFDWGDLNQQELVV